MNEHLIPEGVRQFILLNINSVTQLEGLLVFLREPNVTHTAALLAKRLYIEESEAAYVLDHLCARGFLKRENGNNFLYDPQTAEFKEMIQQVADLYTRYLVPITKIIHSKPKSRIQEFADAFRIRKDKE